MFNSFGAPVYITGLGVISAIGVNTQENLQSLLHGKHGLGWMSHVKSIHKDEIPVCEVLLSDIDIIELLQISDPRGLTRTALLGIKAASEALGMTHIDLHDGSKTALISSTTVGGMNVTEEIYYDLLDANKQGDFLNFIDSHDCGDSTERIADYLGVKDMISTISTACSSSANAIMYGARLIKHGIVDRAICGGTDALSKFTINGFNSLMILSKEHCRPFDNTRVGLNLGEGAGFVVLEGDNSLIQSKSQILAELKGYANTNDAYHQTASSPEGNGAFMAMSTAVEFAELKPEQIDYVNVHGTATPNNDLSEGRAMSRLFGDKIPMFSSTKPYTGHTLAACGGIEAVYSILSLQHGIVFPSLNFKEPMEELPLVPVTLLTESEVNYVLSNSFGFGGNNTSIVFGKA